MKNGSPPNQLWQRLLALVFIIFLSLLSLIATLKPNTFAFVNAHPWGDKVGHFLLFGFAAALLVLALPTKASPVIAMLVISGLVILEEWLQRYSSSRTFSLTDLFASLSGVGFFTVMTAVYRSLRKNSPDR